MTKKETIGIFVFHTCLSAALIFSGYQIHKYEDVRLGKTYYLPNMVYLSNCNDANNCYMTQDETSITLNFPDGNPNECMDHDEFLNHKPDWYNPPAPRESYKKWWDECDNTPGTSCPLILTPKPGAEVIWKGELHEK